jgi:hypothetical protein
MFEVSLFGMAHDLKKFLGTFDPTLGLALAHRIWSAHPMAFFEPEILVSNAQAGCFRDPQLLTRLFR